MSSHATGSCLNSTLASLRAFVSTYHLSTWVHVSYSAGSMALIDLMGSHWASAELCFEL